MGHHFLANLAGPHNGNLGRAHNGIGVLAGHGAEVGQGDSGALHFLWGDLAGGDGFAEVFQAPA